MPSSDPPTVAEPVIEVLASEQPKSKTQTQTNGDSTDTTKASVVVAPVEVKKLTNAELKAQQKAEKAAKRAAAKAGSGPVAAPVVPQVPISELSAAQDKEVVTDTTSGPTTQPTTSETLSTQNAEAPKAWQTQPKKTGASVGETRNYPVRAVQKPATHIPLPVVPKKEDKTVEFFRHLYKPRTTTIAGVNKDVHPAVLALGLQMSNYTICGSCARLVATMQAFKRVSLQ